MFVGRGGHPQTQHVRSDSGPPPAKRAKGNPIITRYPPPPGYAGPLRPGGPPQAQPQPQQWQPSGLNISYPTPIWSAHPTPTYPSPQSGQQPPWSSYQQPGTRSAYSPQSYFPPIAQTLPSPAQTLSTPQSMWHPASASPHSATPSSASTQPWGGQSDPNYLNPNRRLSHSYLTGTDGVFSTVPLDGNGDPLPSLSPAEEDLEDDFVGECYFGRHPEEINPCLSLGLIEWRSALPTKRALPATFKEAELEALAPRNPLPSDEESVSDYFIKSRRDEALLSVRQTDLWQEVQHDGIYIEFSLKAQSYIPRLQIRQRLGDRRDATWNVVANNFSATPSPEPEDGLMGGQTTDYSAENDTMMDSVIIESTHAYSGEQHDVLGSLDRTSFQASGVSGTSRKRKHSRASSTSSINGRRSAGPRPLIPVRDQKQEDILAALGVTGSAKTVYETPGPAFGVPPPRTGSTGSHSRTGWLSSCAPAFPVPPPPPIGGAPPFLHPEYDPWSSAHTSKISQGFERPLSSQSHRTAVGSDFEMAEDDEPTPKAARIDARKRSLAESSEDPNEKWRNDPDENTPKPQRKMSKTQDVYA